MKKEKQESKSTQIWRELLAIFLSISFALMGFAPIANEWRSVIDQGLGTTSTITTNDDKFISDYTDTDSLIQAHIELGKRVAEEGVVLLKNDKKALPLEKNDLKITLFGMGSSYPFMGGTMGSMVTGASQRDLVQALKEKGFDINPEMLEIYEEYGNIKTGERSVWGRSVPVFGHRPSNFSVPYEPSEPAVSGYEEIVPDYSGSFADYNDAAIVVFSRPGAEGSDFYPGEIGIDQSKYGTKSALGLTINEKAVLQLAKDNFEKVIVFINSGSTMEIEELKQDNGVDAIMYIGFPGAYGFLGIADLLKGDTNPSGHLSDTYAVDTANSPAMQNFGKIALDNLELIRFPESLMGEIDPTSPLGSFGGDASMAADHYLIQAEGIYVGYKYYETRYYDTIVGQGNASSAAGASNGASSWKYENEVSYPFGYGLSYTTFEQTINNVNIDKAAKTITAEVMVKNSGDMAGKSVAQLYVQTPFSDYDKENRIEKSAIEFLGMEKTKELNPGESETLTIEVDMKYIASWDSNAKKGKGGYILDGGDYYFTIGNGTHEAINNILSAQGKNVDGNAAHAVVTEIDKSGSVDEKTFACSETGVEVINQLENADINYYKPGYATYLSRTDWEGTFPKTYDDLTLGGEKLEEWVRNLANEVYQFNKGETIDMNGLEGDMILADLAGIDNIDDIRWDELVSQIPVETIIAKIAKGGSTCDVIEEIESPLVFQNDGPNGFGGNLGARGLNSDDKNADFTMGTMANEVILACTFNRDLIREWGELIGNDGLWSGNYTIWGCAANIHRTAYNGRNFEYYSEDPMLSNYMAAATVSGALKYGVIVGPKHFAFNDQETQRSGVAPYMHEQKAREGDLRAFQGAIEEAGALGLMTSFTRIGATPVNGSWGLLQKILRDEWGFKGILSTDMVNNPGFFRPEMCIYAGVTMMADFGRDETMEQVLEKWPYMTLDRIAQDEEFVGYARDNIKYQLYALAQSAAQNVATIQVTPWWETVITAATWISLVIAFISLILYLLEMTKKRKEEE